MSIDEGKYNEALSLRPQNIQKLFPSSKALIVSGKVIHAAMQRRRAAGQPALAIAANGRNDWVIEGALRAALHPTRRPALARKTTRGRRQLRRLTPPSWAGANACT